MSYNTCMLRRILELILELLFPGTEAETRALRITLPELEAKVSCTEPGENTVAFFPYRDPIVRALLHQLKYRGRRSAATLFAQILYAHLLEELEEKSLFENFTQPILIPIPLSSKRRRERGFNQCELIIRELVRLDEKLWEPCFTALYKKVHTESQTSLTGRDARAENVRGVFMVTGAEDIKDRNVILIDDILTTGSTLNEARACLYDAGARAVYAVAIAH